MNEEIVGPQDVDKLKIETEFLDDNLDKVTRFTLQLDSQTNILTGMSSAIAVLAISKITLPLTAVQIPLFILAAFNSLSCIVALFAIHPPRPMRKHGQVETLFYQKNIASFKSGSDYVKAINKVINEPGKVTEQYAMTIYNMAKFQYRPKRRLFNIARNLFLTGVILGLLSFLIVLAK